MKWSIIAGLFLLIVGLCLFTADPAHAADPGINVSPTSGLVTTEAGGTDDFTIVLNALLNGSETLSIGLTSSDTSEGTVSPASVTFNATNWHASDGHRDRR
ncbi:MAG: hypothetical protein WC455_02745 [Dehalococcoidia bacterium]|jgi:hypothetical protein